MLKSAPRPITDVPDFQFQLRGRFKVFDNTDKTPFSKNCNLLTAASRFGLIFVGTTTNFQVIQTDALSNWSKNDGVKSDYPYREVLLESPPRYLSVNCEHTILAVILEKNACPVVQFYDVKSFWSQNIIKIEEARLSPTPEVMITDCNWNPALGSIFTACKSDGSLANYELKNPGIDINELPPAAGATSFCWSPKGKQISVGSRDGKITQYKPDFKAVKMINAPPLKEPNWLISLLWVSNYQFIGMYQPINPDSSACLVVVDAPKAGESSYTNYDDICYSNGSTRPAQFYMILQQVWNVLMVASSNSMEVGILGATGDQWTQWTMVDAARAELPLSADHQDTLPVGFALDISSTKAIIWGDSTLPPAPILLLLSHYGTLCCFNVVNLKEGVPTVCTPPDPISDRSGIQNFAVRASIKTEPVAAIAKQQAVNLIIPKVPTITKTVSFGPSTTPTAAAVPSTFGTETSLFASKPQGVPLFGGQVTLTPVNPAPFQATPPKSILSALKAPPIVATPTTVPSNSALQLKAVPAQTALIQTPVKPQESHIRDPPKPDPIEVRDDAETEALFGQMAEEECGFLQTELQALLHQGRNLKINLGTDADKTKLVEMTNSLEEFFKEVDDISSGQSSEVHTLKQNLFQCWAWFDEAKTQFNLSNDETMAIILRSQPLDSAAEKQLQDIRHSLYYLESQLSQANKALDEQWDAFQDHCRKTHKVEIPAMEAIFQTLVRQTALVKKNSYVLKDIGSRIKGRSRSALGPSLLLSMDNCDVLEEELKQLRLEPKDVCEIQYQHILKRSRCLTKSKSDCLRKFLKNRDFPHVSVLKPPLSVSILTSPSSKSKLSLLGAKCSPVIGEKNVVKKLEFVQSTPKIDGKKMATPPNTPIENLKNFTYKFENNLMTPKSIPPPSFGGKIQPGGPNSAFVSTTFSASTPVTSVAVSKPANFGVLPSAGALKTTLTPSFGESSNTVTSSILSKPAGKPFHVSEGVGSEISITALPKSTTTTSPAIFGSASAKSTFSFAGQSLATSSSIFGAGSTVAPKSSAATMFSFAASTAKPATSIFGNAVKTTEASFVFVTHTTTAAAKPSPFAAIPSTSSSIFGTPTTSSSVFGGPTSVPSSTIEEKFSFGFKSTPAVVSPTSVGASTSIQSSRSTPPANIPDSKLSVTSPPVSFTTTPATSVAPKAMINTVTSPDQSAPVVAATKPSIFGAFAATPTATGSIFGVNSSSTTPSAGPVTVPPTSAVSTPSANSTVSVFGAVDSTSTVTQSQPSIFATAASAAISSAAAASKASSFVPVQGSVFAGSGDVTVKPLFSAPSPSSAATTTTPITTFGGTSFFGSAPTSTAFGSGATVTTTTPLTTQSSVFGAFSSPPTSQDKASVFGGVVPISTTPQTQSIFGAGTTPSVPTTSASVFAAATAASTTPSVFGGAGGLATSQPSIFGSTSTQPSGFGGTQTSIFKSTTAAPTSSVFGGSVTTTSPFGGAVSTESPFGASSPSAFGGTIASSPFGSATTAQFGATSFGTSTTSATSPFAQTQSSASVFGQASAFGGIPATSSSFSFAQNQNTASLFANTATTNTGSIFGSTPTTSSGFGSGGSVFGATPAPGASSPFGSVSSQPAPFSFASSANTGGGPFGFGGLNVTSPVTTSSSTGFGFEQSPAPNPFGNTQSGSIFGGNTASTFGGSTGSAFGSGSSAFGTAPQLFGQQPQQQQQQSQSAFGQSVFGGSSFGSTQAGPFSGGAGSVSQSGFGASPTFQKPPSSGFGSSPVFGAATSAFGAAPSFGSTPAFGGTPGFGSPAKVFGGASPGVAFGSPGNVQNSSFGNLAHQPTVGFGNLAQQASTAQSGNAPFQGNASFSSWR